MRRLLSIAVSAALTGAAPAAAQATRPAAPTVRPAAQQTAKSLDVTYTQFDLPNGLHVILHEDHTVPLVTVNVWYHVGSAREKVGRTGFAHLFEHLMFMGSKDAPYGDFDRLLESVGGTNNASTAEDRTNYYIDIPSNALDLALFLESDRMGFLLDAMSPKTVDAQRDVVKNERRESYENAPYGMASIEIAQMLYPKGHPYSWPTIGYMEDLSAASYEDVVQFFKTYYQPGNASLVIAGDIDTAKAKAAVEKWFADVPAGTTPRRTDRLSASRPAGGEEEDDPGRRAAPAPLPDLDHAAASGPRATPSSTCSRCSSPAARIRASTSDWSTTCRSRRTSPPIRRRNRSTPNTRSWSRRGPTPPIDRIRSIVDEEIARLQQAPPSAHEFRPRSQPGGVVVLRPHGARRRVRRRRRPDECLLR